MGQTVTDDPDLPFGHDTLTLRAAIIPAGAAVDVSDQDIAGTLGPDVVRIPAILVPHGGPPPGDPYVCFGKTMVHPREDEARGGTVSPVDVSVRGDDSAGSPLPRTRFRFGTGLLKQPSAGAPPMPALTRQHEEPVAAAIKALDGLDNAGGRGVRARRRPRVPAELRKE